MDEEGNVNDGAQCLEESFIRVESFEGGGSFGGAPLGVKVQSE